VVLDAPELEYGGEDWDIYHHTIRMAGFATVQPYYINLDVNNPRAYALLERSDLVARLADGGGGGKSSAYARPGWKRAFVRAHVKRLKQGFVFMRKEAGQFTKEYRDFGIQLHALNAERFQRAIAVPLPAPAIDPAKVNSILRPTLPTEPFWSIRDAW
jgi:hypothetical protein